MFKRLRLLRASRRNAIALSKAVDASIARLFQRPIGKHLRDRGITPDDTRDHVRSYAEHILGVDWYRSIVAHRACRKPLEEAVAFWDQCIGEVKANFMAPDTGISSALGSCLALHSAAAALLAVDEKLGAHALKDGAEMIEWLERSIQEGAFDTTN